MSTHMTQLKINKAVSDKLNHRLDGMAGAKPHRVMLLVIGSALLFSEVSKVIDDHSTAQLVPSLEAARYEIERGNLPDILVCSHNDDAAVQLMQSYGIAEMVRFIHAEETKPESIKEIPLAVKELIPVFVV